MASGMANQQAGSRVPAQVNSSFHDESRPEMLPPQLMMAGRMRCCCLRRTQRNPLPKGAESHLWQLAV